MNLRKLFRVISSGVALVTFTSLSQGQVTCWAPGMTDTVTLTEGNRQIQKSFGTPYRYDVFGVAGQLSLGNRATNTEVVNNRFYQKVLGLLGTGAAVESTALVALQTGLTRFYPEFLSVKGSFPGTQIGPVHQYGQNWTLCDPRHPVPVNLTFHLGGSSLLSSLTPGLLSPAYNNLNPSGYFYVLGEYHSAPPVISGELTIAAESVLYGSSFAIEFELDKQELQPVFRPPFLGLDLGDVNLTVLGTPPSSGSNSSTVNLDLPDVPLPDLVDVTIDLSGQQGSGWLKIQRAP